ncbi:MAG TPA: hypothetical protein VGH28_20000 [Polyangiaceae bacterium]|jgi:hypothetical protein
MRSSRSFAAMSAWAVALATLQVLTIAAGLARFVMVPIVARALIASSIAVGVVMYRLLARDVAPWRTLVSRRSGPLLLVAVVVVGALYACIIVSGWAKPELSFDGNTYHVPTIHFWAERGYVHWIVPDEDAGAAWRWHVDALLNAFPKGGELVGFVLVRAFDSSAPANLLSLPFLPLGVFGVICMGRRLGAAPPFALAAGLAWLIVPGTISQVVTTYVDVAFASCLISWLGALLVTLEQLIARDDIVKTLPAAASTIGLTLATKPTGVAAVAIGLVVIAGAALIRDRRDWHVALVHAGIAAGVPLALGLVVGGYWYVRNSTHTGNPVFPVRVAIAGHQLARGLPVNMAIAEAGNTPADLARLPDTLRVLSTWSQGALAGRWPDSVRFYDAREGGLGFLWLLGGLPSIVIVVVRSLRRPSSPESLCAAALFTVTAVCFVATPMHWWARYTLWIHGAGLPALAVVASQVAAHPRWPRLVGAAWLGLAGLLSVRESFVAFRWAATARCFVGEPQPIRNPSDLWRALTVYDGAWSFYHELQNHPLSCGALADGGTVAIASSSVIEAGIIGVVGAPSGKPHVILLDDGVLRDPLKAPATLARNHVSWVFYGAHLAPSAVLEGLARRRESVDGLWVVYGLR